MSSTALKAMKVTESTLNITQYLDTNTSPPVSLEHNSNNMIEIKGVCKRYGTNIILNNLSLTVPEGCIYGLLGSSGCGKTTLLNCLMGISDIEKGAIYVKHSKLSNIGLMPQDTALAPSLTTKEILYYFGKIYNMSDKNIQNRTEEVTTLLEIPSINTVISKLSGGQQRRVSFAVALLHDPKLLLLDEPTVGLDPVLSHHIWDYLIKITSQLNKTIIITTHYIEEAKQAHYVGLMRRGKLIEQGPPTSLMEKYNCSTLEETFLLLSKDDERSINTSSEAVRFNELDRVQEESCNSLSNSEFPPVQSPFSKRDRFSINRIRAQFHKNVLFITREVTFLGFIIFLPILICCIHNWALGGNPKDLTLAVVNSEDNCSNYHFYHGCHLNKSLSCRYLYHLEELKENFHLVHRDDFEEAKALTIDNKFWGLIYFPQNFSSYLIKRFERPFYNWTDDVLDLGTIEVHLDKTDVIISRFLIYSMQMKFTSFLEEIFKDCGWPATLGEYPIRFEDPVYGTRNPLFSQYQAPIMVTNFSFYLPMLVTITYIIHEKSSGFLQRSIASGLKKIELIIALCAIQYIVMSVQIVIMFFIMFKLYNNPFLCNIWLPYTLALTQGFNGIFFGLLLSVISKSYMFAITGGNSVFLIFSTLSGFVWPVQGANPIIANIIWYTPLALPTESFRGMTDHGWTFLHPRIYPGFISSIIWSMLYITILTLIILKKGLIDKK